MDYKKNYLFMGFHGEPREIAPHEFRNDVVVRSGKPRILVSIQAYQDMNKLISMFETEVGWLGTVERKGNVFIIKEIFLFSQLVDDCVNIISAKSLANWANSIMDEREDGDEVISEMKFWGHSHGYSPTNPSMQDERQMSAFAKRTNDFFIRGIGNRLGRLEFTLYLYKEGLEIHDCEWSIQLPAMNEERVSFWQNESSKVELLLPKVDEKKAAYPSRFFQEDEEGGGGKRHDK